MHLLQPLTPHSGPWYLVSVSHSGLPFCLSYFTLSCYFTLGAFLPGVPPSRNLFLTLLHWSQAASLTESTLLCTSFSSFCLWHSSLDYILKQLLCWNKTICMHLPLYHKYLNIRGSPFLLLYFQGLLYPHILYFRCSILYTFQKLPST